MEPIGKLGGGGSIPLYVKLSSSKGVLAAFLVGYFDFLTRSYGADKYLWRGDKESDRQSYYRCEHEKMARDASFALATVVDKSVVERRLNELCQMKLLRRANIRQSKTKQPVYYYAINYDELEPYLLGEENDEQAAEV